MLRKLGLSAAQVVAVIRGEYGQAGLEPAEVAMLEYARKVTLAAYTISEDDIDVLRAHGFSDLQITDIALAAGIRNFWLRMLDSLGAQPDVAYASLDLEIRQAIADLGGHPVPGI